MYQKASDAVADLGRARLPNHTVEEEHAIQKDLFV